MGSHTCQWVSDPVSLSGTQRHRDLGCSENLKLASGRGFSAHLPVSESEVERGVGLGRLKSTAELHGPVAITRIARGPCPSPLWLGVDPCQCQWAAAAARSIIGAMSLRLLAAFNSSLSGMLLKVGCAQGTVSVVVVGHGALHWQTASGPTVQCHSLPPPHASES